MQVSPDSRVVLVVDVRLRLLVSRWTHGSRDEAVVALFSSGRHHALGQSSRVDALRLVCRSVFHPSVQVHEPRERSHVCLSAIVKLVGSGPFGTSHDRRGFSGRRGHREIRNRLSRDHDWTHPGKVAPMRRVQERQSMLNQLMAGRPWSLCVP
jgi:hypothetical protein